MCGIIGLFKMKEEGLRQRALDMAKKIRHRGPDATGVYEDDEVILVHERLSIVDPEGGAQPLIDTKTGSAVIVNGEIYDHSELRKKLKKEQDWQTKSDCEILLYLYEEYGPKFLDMLDGIFAFALYDKQKGDYFIARDHIGIMPLYVGWDKKGTFHVASEMKALDPYCDRIIDFPPGHYYLGSENKFVKWYKPKWKEEVPKKKLSLKLLREELEKSVKKQLMSDVPFGVLISGGLDSSLIAAIASKYSKDPLHSFSIGLTDSPDLKFARTISDYLGTEHHEFIFTVEEGLEAIKDVIHHLETFDVTTIRASTPMYLMVRKIKSMGIKMVLSGEGADEIFGGYLYFHKAPSPEEFHRETVDQVSQLSKDDCLRANKSTMAWGVEVRVPFLGKDFLDYSMAIDPKEKMCLDGRIEKYILRKAFEGYLPEEILWRQKEQFSDGVGYGWIDYLKEYAESKVTNEMMEKSAEVFPEQTPLAKEGYLYRVIFEELFKSKSAVSTVLTALSIACSTPRALKWSKEFEGREDPSGRAVKGVHEDAVEAI